MVRTHTLNIPIGGFDKWGYPKNDGLSWTYPIKMDDLGVPPISGNLQILACVLLLFRALKFILNYAHHPGSLRGHLELSAFKPMKHIPVLRSDTEDMTVLMPPNPQAFRITKSHIIIASVKDHKHQPEGILPVLTSLGYNPCSISMERSVCSA